MPRQVNEAEREATSQAIKTTARQLMAEKGTAGLSLRAIAREMGMTAPALYHYFANMDALITALIVDAFNALADALEDARDATADQSPAQQMWAATMAYRQYALDYPTDFQLIYGSPIPGYDAPGDVTIPASSRTLFVFAGLIQAMVEAGEMTLPSHYVHPPDPIAEHLYGMKAKHGYDLTLDIAYATFSAWPRMHGIVMLELFNHLGPTIGDTDAFYTNQMCTLFAEMGADITPP